MNRNAEYEDGFESATREIAVEGLTPWQAQDHLAAVEAVEGDDFDAGFRSAMGAHAAKAT